MESQIEANNSLHSDSDPDLDRDQGVELNPHADAEAEVKLDSAADPDEPNLEDAEMRAAMGFTSFGGAQPQPSPSAPVGKKRKYNERLDAVVADTSGKGSRGGKATASSAQHPLPAKPQAWRRTVPGRTATFAFASGSIELPPGVERPSGVERLPGKMRPPGMERPPGVERPPGMMRPPGVEGPPGIERLPVIVRPPGVEGPPGRERLPVIERPPGTERPLGARGSANGEQVEAYYKPSFIEDPWAELLAARAQGINAGASRG